MRRIAIALVLGLTALTASAGTIEQSFDQTYDVRSGASFSLVNTNGSITIHSWDQPRIRIHANKRVRGSSDEAKQAMAELKIEVTPAAGGLNVVTRYPKRGDNNGLGVFDWMFGSHVDASVTYDVTVPRSMSLDLENTNGAIEVTDVRGSHKVNTTNGRIELARCAGDVAAETTNGGIKAELIDVTPGKRVSLETTNGRISLAAPPTLAANVDASTTNGSVDTDLPVTTTGTGRHSLRGTMNGGGASLRLRTTNGSIEIRAAR